MYLAPYIRVALKKAKIKYKISAEFENSPTPWKKFLIVLSLTLNDKVAKSLYYPSTQSN